MKEERFVVTKYENNPDWDRIDIKQKWSEWGIEGHLDGDVEFSCYTIEFLQSKVK